MKKKSILILLGVTIVRVVRADVSPFQNESDITLAFYRYQSSTSSGFLLGTGNVGLGYGRILNDYLELTIRAAFKTSSNASTIPGDTSLTVTAGPTFNFPMGGDGISDAFFLRLGGGINYSYINSLAISGTYYTVPAQSATAFAYDLAIGKRFSIFSQISWVPTFSVSGFIGSDLFNGGQVSTPVYNVIPLKISIFF